ncbi:hypothetical protein D9M71_587310 [compost metagenome]
MAEELALHQGFREGATVHRHERTTGAATEVVEMPGHQLLAGAGFPDDQGVGLAGGQALDAAKQVTGGRVLENEHGGPDGLGQFTSVGEGKQRHGAFLAAESAGE